MTKNEKKLANILDKIAHFLINFYFYFYLLFSILTIIFYYFNIISVFKVLFIIMISIYALELMCGFDRNFIGVFGVIISGSIGYFVFNSTYGIMLGISIAILIISILKLILNLFINKTINNSYKNR